ncbi:acetate--CoA ligase [Hydrogenibacillus schlegelii]|uniref:acetate--CoA ligase n=1 Tax=Hydrogenibacillus schlegelii TaxID=1484 RepID=UPI0009E971BE|nr:acetate--CoA ligase [Hydrogenibacillus schlegelii]
MEERGTVRDGNLEAGGAIYVGKSLEPPTEVLRRKAPLSDLEAAALLEEARLAPERYWARIAGELAWFSPWHTLVEGTIERFRYFVGGLSNVCYNCLDRHLPARKNKVALFYEREDGRREVWTYRELVDAVGRLAAALRRAGVGTGDRVAVYMTNAPETFIYIHALTRIGAIYTVLFAGFSEEAIRERLRDFRPKLVLTADYTVRRGRRVPLKATLDGALQGLDGIERIVVARRFPEEPVPMGGRDVGYDEFVAGIAKPAPVVPVEANAPGFVIYTSGTTAKPKGLVHSGIGFLVGAYANVKWSLNLQDDDVYWCTADVGWLTFPIFALVGGLAHGATLVVYEGAPDHPTPGRFYDLLARYRVNKVFTAPTLLRMLRRAGDDWIHGTEDLELVALVGEPLDPETYHWTKERLGGGRIFVNNTYGQTETGTAWASSIVGLSPTKPGAAGHPLPGYAAEVVDEFGQPVPAGELGFLVLTRPFPSLARTVWGDPERYREIYFSRIPGKYFSGDAAILDPDGQLWVTGRVDDVINVSGHRIGTMELEAALINHPAVAEAAVVGEPDPIRGEVPVAFVILRSGVAATDRAAREALEREFAEAIVREIGAYARPARVFIVPTLPRTRSGKIMRRLLRELRLKGDVAGDLTTLDNPDAIAELKALRERGEL